MTPNTTAVVLYYVQQVVSFTLKRWAIEHVKFMIVKTWVRMDAPAKIKAAGSFWQCHKLWIILPMYFKKSLFAARKQHHLRHFAYFICQCVGLEKMLPTNSWTATLTRRLSSKLRRMWFFLISYLPGRQWTFPVWSLFFLQTRHGFQPERHTYASTQTHTHTHTHKMVIHWIQHSLKCHASSQNRKC